MSDGWVKGEFWDRLPDGRILICVDRNAKIQEDHDGLLVRFRRSRSGSHHRLYWRILSDVVDGTDRWTDADALHRWAKVQLRMFDVSEVSADGKATIRLRSTKFSEMDQTEFESFFDRAMMVIAEEVGFDPMEMYADA